ncbi:MAG TPA: LuxR family transcriptional regulator [Rhizobiales bacterium]|nr:LuxR family transcriptional regulator [Hyphomicrobiales bacterium]
MAAVARQALEFAEKMHDGEETGKALDVFSDYTRFYGFESFLVCSHRVNQPRPRPLALAESWPKAWCERYIERDYHRQDPIAQYGLSHRSEIFRWRDVLKDLRGNSPAHIVFSEQGYFGLKDGYSIPLVFSNGDYSSVQLGSSIPVDLGEKDQRILTLASRFLIDILRAEAYGVARSDSENLSAREREVLLWAAHGKTPWETSEILNIAERTVLCHIESARRKLNAANATHAVALALSRGQIQV